MQKKLNKDICLFLKIKKIIPSNKQIYYIILIIKLIPLLVITHDWDLNSNKGISKWIRKFTLAEIINNITISEIFYIIGIIGFILSIIDLLLSFYFKSKVDLEGNINSKYNKELTFFSYNIFFLFYAFTQYYYSFFVELIFSSRKNIMIYLIGVILFSISVIFAIINSVNLSSIIIHEPMFIYNRSPLLNPLNKLDYYSMLISIIQIFIQAEFHLKFKEFILMKIIIRSIYCLIFIKIIFDFNVYYSSFTFYKLLFLYLCICFISCVIEFIFLYDYNNNLKILQKDEVTIIFKIIIEILISLIIVELHFYFDNRKLRKNILNFNHNNPKSFNMSMIKFINNVYYQEQPFLLRKIFFDLYTEIKKRIHNPKCKNKSEKCYYCEVFNSQNYLTQMNFYIEKIKESDKFNYNCIKKNFPLLVGFIDYEINFYETMTFDDTTIIDNIFFVIVYFFIYNHSYYRCIYLLEKIKEKPKIKKSFYCLAQIETLKEKILRIYNNNLHQSNGRIQMITIEDDKKHHSSLIKQYLRSYRSIDRIIYLESEHKKFLFNYMNLMNNFNDDYISFERFKKEILKFNENYKRLNKETNNILKTYKCTIIYSYIKFTTFYQYYRNSIPKNIEEGLENFFSEQLSSLVLNSKNYYALIFEAEFVKNNIEYKIRYVSNDLIHKLKYTKFEFKNLTPENIFPKTFYKSYIYNFTKTLEQGMDVIQLNNCCLLDKEKYVLLYDLSGSTIFRQNKIEFYFKLTEAKEQIIINKNTPKLSSKNKTSNINSIKLNHYYGACFLFTNRLGKIQNLSRGFEDFFFLNSEVLTKYNIYINDLFKFEKFHNQGNFTQNLSSVYNNINEIYMREVGQLGEDAFSKIIIPLNEFKNSMDNSSLNFHVEVNFKEKKLNKGKNKIKYYFIFTISIYEDISPLSINYTLINSGNIRHSFFSQKSSSKLTELDINKKQNNDGNKLLYDFPYDNKISKIKFIGNLILEKYMKFKKSHNEKTDNLINNNLNELNNEHKNNNNDNKNNNSSNTNKGNNNNSNIDSLLNLVNHNQNKKINPKIKNINFFVKYYSIFVEIIFLLSFFIIYIQKIEKIKNQTNYFSSYHNLLMFGQTIHQITLKVTLMQFQSNNLQIKMINNIFDNSFLFHMEKLKERITDYLSFKENFYKFFIPFTGKLSNEKSEYSLSQKLNYSLVDLKGNKVFSESDTILTNLNIELLLITNHSDIILIYNNSDYYFNENIIKMTNYNYLEYFSVSICYIRLLGTFYFTLLFQLNETYAFFLQLIHKIIDDQFNLSLINFYICIVFAIFYIFEFYIFVVKSNSIFSKYFLCHLQIRFFNKFLLRKTYLVLSFFENFSVGDSLIIFDNLIIQDHKEEDEILKLLLTEQVEDSNMIKVKPYISNCKYDKNITLNLGKNYNIENENNEINNQNETLSFSSNIKKIIDANKQSMFYDQKNPRTKLSSTKINFDNTNYLLSKNKSMKKEKEKEISNPLNNKSHILTKQKNGNTLLNLNIFNTNSLGSNKVLLPKQVTTNQTEQSNNSTLNKSSVPLNESSNRTNASGKSTLKLINKSPRKRNKKNNNENNNVKSNNSNNKYIIGQSGFKLLQKPYLHLYFFFTLIPMIIIFIVISSIQIIYSVQVKKKLEKIIDIENFFFEDLNYISEFVILYDLSILYNEEITIEYSGTKYSLNCDKFKKVYSNNEKIKLYELLIMCYPEKKKEVDKIIYEKTNLKNVKNYLNKINSNEFCEYYAKFIYENKYDPSFPSLIYLDVEEENNLYNECINIGGNLNSKGFKTAKETIFQIMVDFYNDFKKDNNRTELSNYERVNNEYILFFQNEVSRIIRKVALGYMIVFSRDLTSFKNSTVQNELLLMCAIFFSSFIVGFIYIFNVKKACRELSYVEFFNDCVLNTIIFQ